ncbi:MmgE/PrpD family protein [Halobacterium sp. KA-6]|uniref:MmgE/PrpD family protein n=1 Tax=Halobacterium sp. KA-6 TaxID=2896368 RepID=UPI001E629A73|nr:MmgE/PrpD family protein [Halobacterium sp. KA-6]MCD2203371.1 MmgE/PrpD family protein [Halobacterium sp. KA-6]
MTSPEAALSDFIATVTYEDIPKPARETIKRAFVDTVGVTLAGAIDDAGSAVFEIDGVDTSTAGVPTILGIKSDRSPTDRALHTGTASHALDYDDLAWSMDGHPSVTLVPPLLALADEANASGKDLITAFAAGFEVECALADPISPDHYESGWHATATFGTFGAAAAAASLLDLSAAEARHVLNVAASMPAGLKRNFGSMTKPLHAGLAARSGVTAARLAGAGFSADSDALSGVRGFWDLYGPKERTEFTFDSDEWILANRGIHIKYYPCCYFTHTSIAGTQTLVNEHDISPENIELIHVRVAQGAADALHHSDPETGLEAKFSLEYTVACAAVRDRVGLGVFDQSAIQETDVQRVRERVEYEVDDNLHYDSHEAVVRIETNDGTYERQQVNPPGTHDNPLTDAELREKFNECAGRAISKSDADALVDVFTTLEEHEDVVATIGSVTEP